MAIEIDIYEHISTINPHEWNAVTGSDPFASHGFLSALANSESAVAQTGWQALHLAAREAGEIKALAPLWLKMHSYGEYIFDHAFADAYERHGLDYYPKLLAATPFTPVNGARLHGQNEPLRAALAEAMIAIAKENHFSSVHINFADDIIPDEARWHERHNVQYHFHNRNYENFDEFLAKLSSAKRKMIRKERRGAQSHGLTLTMKTGAELTAGDWDCFWRCYQDTGSRKWGTPYLTRAFFDEIAESMAASILMGLAYDDGRPVAAALHFRDQDRLIGRYWGTLAEYKFLHLELCYYQAIEYAITNGISLIEAGAQGEHKIARGYEPVMTKSYHHFVEPEFHKLIGRYIAQERRDLAHYAEAARAQLPFAEGRAECA